MRIFLVMLLVAFVPACSTNSTDTTSGTTDAPVAVDSTTTTPPAPPATQDDGGETTTTASTTTTTTAPADDRIFVVVEGGEVTSERRAEVTLGDELTIVILADIADELHIHGYDIFADTQPGEEVVVSFVAEIPGVFELELEGARLEVLELVVNQ